MRAEIAVFLLNLSETFLRTAPHRRTWKLLRVTTKLQVAEGLNVTCALFNHSCVVVIINAYSTTYALRHYKQSSVPHTGSLPISPASSQSHNSNEMACGELWHSFQILSKAYEVK